MNVETADAVVVLSGGQDSATCLFWALRRYDRVEALTFDYGARHGGPEIDCAERLVYWARDKHPRARVGHTILEIAAFRGLGSNAMVDHDAEIDESGDLPTTFVPGRNLVFLTLAAARAAELGAGVIVTGVSEIDYSGYPDCRPETISSLEDTLCLGLDRDVTISTPLIDRSKADTWGLAAELGVVDLIREETHTCYNGVRDHLYPWGYGCDECPACRLRREGFEEWKA